MNPYDAILMIAFGGPTRTEEIRPFLERVTRGLPISPQRLEEVAHHYEAVGGKSPLNEITFRQAQALQKELHRRRMPLPVFVGLRNAAPFFTDALKEMSARGVRRVLGFILSSHRTEASWERYQRNIAQARLELNGAIPEVDFCGGWHDHPLFIRCWGELVESSLAEISPPTRRQAPLVFTAHSVPLAMAENSPYVEQLQSTARAVAELVGQRNWSLAYQSRSGRPSDPWLEPDIGVVIRALAAQKFTDVVAAPIGFVCDHVEVLYDLDIEAAKIAEQAGLKLHRAACPNDHPVFIAMIADVIEQTVRLRAP